MHRGHQLNPTSVRRATRPEPTRTAASSERAPVRRAAGRATGAGPAARVAPHPHHVVQPGAEIDPTQDGEGQAGGGHVQPARDPGRPPRRPGERPGRRAAEEAPPGADRQPERLHLIGQDEDGPVGQHQAVRHHPRQQARGQGEQVRERGGRRHEQPGQGRDHPLGDDRQRRRQRPVPPREGVQARSAAPAAARSAAGRARAGRQVARPRPGPGTPPGAARGSSPEWPARRRRPAAATWTRARRGAASSVRRRPAVELADAHVTAPPDSALASPPPPSGRLEQQGARCGLRGPRSTAQDLPRGAMRRTPSAPTGSDSPGVSRMFVRQAARIPPRSRMRACAAPSRVGCTAARSPAPACVPPSRSSGASARLTALTMIPAPSGSSTRTPPEALAQPRGLRRPGRRWSSSTG